MGMDLTVWRREPRPIPGVEAAWLERDPQSGQWFSERVVPIPDECVAAARARVGNIAMLSHLREVLEPHRGRAPTILALVWEPGGSGRLFAGEDVRRLTAESHALLSRPSLDLDARALCTTLLELGGAAEREGNPIEVG